jgi:hypothetical protein
VCSSDLIPEGTTLGLPRYPQPAHSPLFRFDRYHLVVFESLEHLSPGKYPDYLVTDFQGLDSARLARAGYVLAKEFRPYKLGWTDLTAEKFFNTSIYIFRRDRSISAS